MSETQDRPQSEEQQQGALIPPPIVQAEALFRGHREVCIEHDGKRYRLRITRRNKLILQK